MNAWSLVTLSSSSLKNIYELVGHEVKWNSHMRVRMVVIFLITEIKLLNSINSHKYGYVLSFHSYIE